MSKSIDFSSLTLQDALDLAILVEEEAQERYLELADQMDTHRTWEAAEFFRFMAGNEAKHGLALAKKRRVLFDILPRRVDRSMLWDVEAPSYDTVRAFMHAREAYSVALRSEEKAYQFFVDALGHVTDPEVKELFEELKEEEIEHQELVKKELSKLPPGPDPDIESFVDEPVAQ